MLKALSLFLTHSFKPFLSLGGVSPPDAAVPPNLDNENVEVVFVKFMPISDTVNVPKHLATEHFKYKLTKQSGLFENEIGPEVPQSTVQQTCPLQDVKGTPCRLLTIFQFCSCCLEFLQGDACWTLNCGIN